MARSVRFRRARHLISCWTDEGVVTWNYAAGKAVVNDAIVHADAVRRLDAGGRVALACDGRHRFGGRLSAIDGLETARAFRPAGGSA